MSLPTNFPEEPKIKIFESEIYGSIYQPSSFGDIIKLSQQSPRDNPEVLIRMWRGQGDINWPLHSTAYRRLALTKEVVSETDLQFYEKNLLKHADHKGYRYLHGRCLPDLELLARLRHHGAATRFIDTTKNLLVGLWFSVSEQQKKTGLLLGFHAHSLGGDEGYLEERPYDEIFKDFNNYKYEHPQTWEAPTVSPRIATQHSQFVYSPIVHEVSGSVILPKEKGDVLAMAIAPKLKKKCKIILEEVFDIRQITLFPDLDGFGYANSQRFDQWSNLRW